MIIKEFRIIMPMTVEEYQVAQLYSVAEASKNETGGGEGIEVLHNCKYDVDDPSTEKFMVPDPLLLDGVESYRKGQYTWKIYHLERKVPRIVRAIAPKDSLKVHETAWNAYPYCRTIVTNPDYMKSNFYIKIETMHVSDNYNIENVHNLTPEQLRKREIHYIDIVNDPLYSSGDYKPEHDPSRFKSQKTNRGPLQGNEWWRRMGDVPVMCAYKLVTCHFKWFGLQGAVESMIIKQEQRIFQNFHRQVFCWMDKWHGLTMDDIRAIEDRTKYELDEERLRGEVKGTMGD